MDSKLHDGCLFNGKINPELKVSVIVPVRNEAETVYGTLMALNNQMAHGGQSLNFNLYEILLLVNNCTDDTLTVCKAFQQQNPKLNLHIEYINLPKANAHVGTARRILMDAAYRRLMEVTGEKGIIVSTDGDSEVDRFWLSQILNEFSLGVDVVGGRILCADVPQTAKLHHLRNVGYRHLKARLESEIDPCRTNPWPHHFQCYGPSLAVSCGMYHKAGRIPAIPFLEDEEFRKALKRMDAKIRNSPHVKVYTSSRMDGRVSFGFSVQLQQWAEMGEAKEESVESLGTLIFKFKLKQRLRTFWGFQENLNGVEQLCRSTGIDLRAIGSLWKQHIYFESFWEELESVLNESHKIFIVYQPISEAISTLRNYFSDRQKSILKPVQEQTDSSIIAV